MWEIRLSITYYLWFQSKGFYWFLEVLHSFGSIRIHLKSYSIYYLAQFVFLVVAFLIRRSLDFLFWFSNHWIFGPIRLFFCHPNLSESPSCWFGLRGLVILLNFLEYALWHYPWSNHEQSYSCQHPDYCWGPSCNLYK